GDAIEEEYAPVLADRKKAVGNRAQGHGKAFLFRGEIFGGAFALNLGSGARREDLQRAFNDVGFCQRVAVEHADDAHGFTPMIGRNVSSERCRSETSRTIATNCRRPATSIALTETSMGNG